MCEFDKIQGAVREERRQCLEDRRFYSIAGAQWEGSLGEQFANKPKFEVNKVHLSVIRIINEYRNNKISVEFTSKDGVRDIETADACSSLFRADEQDSCADEAYDNAFEEAVGGGFGAFRLRAEYEDDEDDENEYQRIYFEPIYDADSCVFFDLNAKRQDKSDAEHCFVLTAMTRDAFIEEWGDNVSTIGRNVTERQFDWTTADQVYVAEYYKVEHKKDTLSIWQSITGEEEKYKSKDFKDDPDLELSLENRGFTKVREKKIKVRRIHKYIISGQEILEDCGYIAGKEIPIIPVYGKRWFIDGIERMMGHVRLCKDAQRLKNMQLSKLGELSAYSSIQKPIFTPEQIVGHEHMWAQDNVENYPFLMANALKDASGNPITVGPQAYTQTPQVPPAMAALLTLTDQDIKEILGNQEGGEEIQSNISGKAVELIQTRLDMQSYIYISNMSKAIKRAGQVWLSMAADVYNDEDRSLKAVGTQGEISSIELVKPMITDDGETIYENDLSNAKLDVAVEVGPTSSSKKSAVVSTLTNILPMIQDPETSAAIQGMIMMNLEGEGMNDFREFFRQKMIRIGAVKPNEEEQQQLAEEAQNQQPDPQTLYLQAEAAKSEALAMKAQADTGLTTAKRQETIAKTAEILAGIDRDDKYEALDSARQIQEMVAAPPQVSESNNGNV